ncbi:MAG: ABC transporter substrate-binding protein, partial [Polyangiales bacterium]
MRSIRRREPGWLRLLLSVILSAASCTPPPRTPRYVGAGKTGPRHGGRFVFYAESNVRHLDPHLAYDELSLMAIRLLFDGLLDYNHKAELIPSLARQVPQAELGGRFYRFELQRGVRFHHGRELTAEDVRWSMEHMLHPKTGSPGFTFFSHLVGLQAFRQGKARHIRGIQVLDRYQVSFRLKQPDQ